GGLTLVAARGQSTSPGNTLSWVSEPHPCADGSVLFQGYDNDGYVFLVERDGQLSVELRPGETLTEPARFTTFDGGGAHLSSGPFMAADGSVIFDADVTGRRRGLYLRLPNGVLRAIALDGDPAPGGGHFTGYGFSFHTVASGGRVAFVGMTSD